MTNNLQIKKKSSEKNLIDIYYLIKRYYSLKFDDFNVNSYKNKIIFGTSGHRGSSKHSNFNELHILAITQAIVQERKKQGVFGPCFVGKDTHALSDPAFISVLEVLTANFINVIIQKYEYTPTPVISHAIISYNKNINNIRLKADGIILTSSHNPPEDGGIKYNFIYGGPACISITYKIEKYANKFLVNKLKGVRRITINQARSYGYIHVKNFMQDYVKNLSNIININAIKSSGLKLGVDPLGGSSVSCWESIAEYHQLNLMLINNKIDKTFSFICLDYDGIIRMDCSSESVVSKLLLLLKSNKNIKLDLIFVNDPDCDRHGIITSHGLIKPNDYLLIAINYLFKNRSLWKHYLSIGKTQVSSMIINQIALNLNRHVFEVPVGFKWFVKGLFNGLLGFVGEESAGASFLSFNNDPWSTDKDGFIMCLLASEIIAVTNQSLQEYYKKITYNFDIFNYKSTQVTINNFQKKILYKIFSNKFQCITELAEDPIIQILNIKKLLYKNKSIIEGIKIITKNGWAICRLSGTEKTYKIYCESFIGSCHRKKIEKSIINFIQFQIKKYQ